MDLLDEEVLNNLYELHELYFKSLDIMGDLTADSSYIRDTAYIERKQLHARTMKEENGTVADKEASAELKIRYYREQERNANFVFQKYKLKYDTFSHKLYDIKVKRANMERELQNTSK